jgi:hypothetical protein
MFVANALHPYHHAAIIGRPECGKTSLMKGYVGWLLETGQKVVVIDPTDSWWGIRIFHDGSAPSIYQNIAIMGGKYGDLPLDPTAGVAIASMIVRHNYPVILSTANMRAAERTRFFLDFATALVNLNETQIYVILDDADDFFQPSAKNMDVGHAARQLVTVGGKRMIRMRLVSREPGRIGSDILALMHTIIAMRIVAPGDRAMLKPLMAFYDLPTAKPMWESLPSLSIGEAWVCAPQDKRLERTSFPAPDTMDVRSPLCIPVPKSDAANIKTALNAAGISIGRDDELAELHRRVDSLERTLAHPKVHFAAIRQEIQRTAASSGFDICRHAVDKMLANTGISINGLADKLDALAADLPSVLPDDDLPEFRHAHKSHRNAQLMSDAERRVLTAAVQFPAAPPRTIAMVAGYPHEDGIFLAAAGMLRRYRFLATDSMLIPTTDGIDALGSDFEILPTGQKLLQFWADQLSPSERLVICEFVRCGIAEMSTAELRALCGNRLPAGDFIGFIRKLDGYGLVRLTRDGKKVFVAEQLSCMDKDGGK